MNVTTLRKILKTGVHGKMKLVVPGYDHSYREVRNLAVVEAWEHPDGRLDEYCRGADNGPGRVIKVLVVR
jgi:hypothetical protein